MWIQDGNQVSGIEKIRIRDTGTSKWSPKKEKRKIMDEEPPKGMKDYLIILEPERPSSVFKLTIFWRPEPYNRRTINNNTSKSPDICQYPVVGPSYC